MKDFKIKNRLESIPRKYTNKRINEKKRKRRSMNSRVEYFNILKSVMWESVESVC